MGILRKTKSVKILLEKFANTEYALSVVELVKELEPKMNKTTVYRILERLEEEVVLHSFMSKDGLKYYAKCKGCSSSQHNDLHPHFQCKSCGKTECLNLDMSVPSVPNHKIDSAELLLVGLCENCIS